jgi:hypothetical protein
MTLIGAMVHYAALLIEHFQVFGIFRTVREIAKSEH